MQPFRQQRGSAVVEFVMLGAPALLLMASGITLFLNGYLDTLARAVAIDASRYAALADQDYASARSYLDQKLSYYFAKGNATASLAIYQVAAVDLQYQPLPNLFSLSGGPVHVRVVTPVENQ